MLSFKVFICEKAEMLNDVSHWEVIPHSQLGSNPASVLKDPEGNKHYVKFYHNPDQARSELAANKINERLGVHTLSPSLVMHKGKLGFATKWRSDMRNISPEEFEHSDNQHQLAHHFQAAVLTKNWDATGQGWENMAKDASGKIYNLDAGAAFKFRAMGSPKPYDSAVHEYKSMRDPNMNYYSHHAFKSLRSDHIDQAIHTAMNINPADIHHDFASSGVSNPEEHAQTFLKRRQNFIDAHRGGFDHSKIASL